MSLRKLPEIHADGNRGALRFNVRPDALQQWDPGVHAADGDAASISIYDVIGEDFDGSGVTAKRIGAALRNIGARDVVVNINSPGGDFFEGVAIYNQLRAHPARVTVQVMGIAASAASVIAMAGDDIRMGDGAFLMIHNAWAIALGNRHDLADAAERLAPFDAAMASVYAARSGMSVENVAALMDKETWLSASQAVADGFATGLLDAGHVVEDDASSMSARRALAMIETAMAQTGYSRSARRDVLKSVFSGTPCAAEPTTPCAGDDIAALAALQQNIQTITRSYQ